MRIGVRGHVAEGVPQKVPPTALRTRLRQSQGWPGWVHADVWPWHSAEALR